MNSNVSKYIIPFSIIILALNALMVVFIYVYDNTDLFKSEEIVIQTDDGELVIQESDLVPTSFPVSFPQ